MRATLNNMQVFNNAGQGYVELVPSAASFFGIYVIAYAVCKSVCTVVYALSFTNKETGAYAAVSLFVLLLFVFLLTYLTLIGLARLSGLRSLVGLTTRLARSTA